MKILLLLTFISCSCSFEIQLPTAVTARHLRTYVLALGGEILQGDVSEERGEIAIQQIEGCVAKLLDPSPDRAKRFIFPLFGILGSLLGLGPLLGKS